MIENGVAVIRPAGPGDPPPPNMRSLARINEIGTLYGILAGMLNLILIFDAFLPRPKKARGRGAGPDPDQGRDRGGGVMPVIPVLAYTPFIDPIDLHAWWQVLLVPLAILLAIGYKAVRVSEMSHLPRAAAVFTVQIIGGIVALAAVFYLVVIVVLPRIAPMPG